MTTTQMGARLHPVDDDSEERPMQERGRQLKLLIAGTLGLNQSEAHRRLRAHFGTFDYKTLGRLYKGQGSAHNFIRVERWAEEQAKALHRGATGDAGDDVEVTGQSEKHIAFKFRGVKGYGIEDVEVVVPIEYADLGREAVRDLMREVMRGQHPEKSDPEEPET